MKDISVVIPTSPIPSHPSPEIISRVIASIRHQLPESPIYIMADGVRPELEHRAIAYARYFFNLGEMLAFSENIQAHFATRHEHQSGMMQMAFRHIDTPLVLIVEHDCVLDDKPIDWEAITNLLKSDEANLVRLYWNSEPHPEHLHLMGERRGPFVKTTQYSGWPHIAKTDFYRELMATYFSDRHAMLETVLYSPFVESPWEKFKTWIYCPEGDGVRFHHLNGRVDPATGEKEFGDW